MGYISVIKNSLLLFPAIALIFTIPFVLYEYHKYGSINKLRTFIVYSFILYMMTMYFLVILPLPDIEEVRNLTTPKIQLIPFKFIYDFIKDTPFRITDIHTYIPALKHSSFYVVFFNILMTAPFGMYLRYYYKFDLKKVIKYSFLLSLFFELTQLSGLYFIYPRPYRLCDVDDLIMNTLGGLLGYFIMTKVEHLLPTRDDIDNKSLKDGMYVSGLKRLTLFIIDTVICGLFICLAMTLFNYKIVKNIIIFIYYVTVPMINHDQTIGSKFLNIKFSTPKLKGLYFLFRIVAIYIYWIIIPFGSISLSTFVINAFSFSDVEIMAVYFIDFIFFFFFYLLSIINLLSGKKMFYDRFTKVEYVSTIKVK